jgi:hypothetical protein
VPVDQHNFVLDGHVAAKSARPVGGSDRDVVAGTVYG